MRRRDRDLHTLAGWNARDGREIDRQRVAFVDDARVVAEFFGRAVVIEEAVVFPFHVVQFGVDVAGDLPVAAQFIGEEFETPAYIAIAIERADAAVFAVDERLAFVLVTGNIIERRTDVGIASPLFQCVPWPCRNRAM